MRRHAVAYAIFILLLAVVPTSAFGQFSVLYNFGSVSGDGRNPAFSGIIAQGRDGNLYTTTPSGGSRSASIRCIGIAQEVHAQSGDIGGISKDVFLRGIGKVSR